MNARSEHCRTDSTPDIPSSLSMVLLAALAISACAPTPQPSNASTGNVEGSGQTISDQVEQFSELASDEHLVVEDEPVAEPRAMDEQIERWETAVPFLLPDGEPHIGAGIYSVLAAGTLWTLVAVGSVVHVIAITDDGAIALQTQIQMSTEAETIRLRPEFHADRILFTVRSTTEDGNVASEIREIDFGRHIPRVTPALWGSFISAPHTLSDASILVVARDEDEYELHRVSVAGTILERWSLPRESRRSSTFARIIPVGDGVFAIFGNNFHRVFRFDSSGDDDVVEWFTFGEPFAGASFAWDKVPLVPDGSGGVVASYRCRTRRIDRAGTVVWTRGDESNGYGCYGAPTIGETWVALDENPIVRVSLADGQDAATPALAPDVWTESSNTIIGSSISRFVSYADPRGDLLPESNWIPRFEADDSVLALGTLPDGDVIVATTPNPFLVIRDRAVVTVRRIAPPAQWPNAGE